MKYPFVISCIGLATLGLAGCQEPSPHETFEELFGFQLCENARIDRVTEQTKSPPLSTAYTYMVVVTMSRSCIDRLHKDIKARSPLECHSGSCSGRFKNGSMVLQDRGNSVYIQYDI